MMSFLATRKPKGQGECDDSVFKIMQNKGQGRTDQDFNGSQNGRQIQNRTRLEQTRNSRMPLGNSNFRVLGKYN